MNGPRSQPAQPAPLVAAKDVVMRFRSGEGWLTVLHGVTAGFRAGELTLLTGPSGCGKTTLISILTGILTPSSGEVTLGGEHLAALSAEQKAVFRRRNIGFIFQQYNLLPHLTAEENASVALVADGTPFARAVVPARAMLSELGLGAHAGKYPRQLSGGQQQRVAIARALVHRPRFVVCDEPTSALDAVSGQKVMEILAERASGPRQAVIVVTHDDRIFHFADRIVRMADGRIEHDASGPTEAGECV